MRRGIKTAAVLTALVFVLVLVSPAVFSVCRGSHACCGPDCRVCERLAVALRQLGGVTFAAVSVIFALGFVTQAAVRSCSRSRPGVYSLVRLKVKLID